jgi:hypothetical protein
VLIAAAALAGCAVARPLVCPPLPEPPAAIMIVPPPLPPVPVDLRPAGATR